MAKSYSHTYGEIIGDFFEMSVIRCLRPVVEKRGFYLDYRHKRKSRNGKKEVSWKDGKGNAHKLDIVVEEDGTERETGNPRAFIEVAWRRYTKHSKNKAQEISGAILPLVERYRDWGPFYSAVLSGDFTENALKQLRSEGFAVCYISTEKMQEVFSAFGMKVDWEEKTPESDFEKMIERFQSLSKEQPEKLYKKFVEVNQKELEKFKKALTDTLSREAESFTITPVQKKSFSFSGPKDAHTFVKNYEEENLDIPVACFIVTVEFDTGESCHRRCRNAEEVKEYLKRFKKK